MINVKEGLSSVEATELLKEFGLNELVETRKKNIFIRFLEQYKNLFLIILILASIASFFLGDYLEGTIILIIILINGLVGLYQEGKASKAIELLKKQLKKTSNVYRDGKEISIESKYLVPGDILIIREGEILPADGILTEANSLLINESILTGESLPINKQIGDIVSSGTLVIKGSAKMKVKKTGMKTSYGKIAELTDEEINIKSPLQVELEELAKYLGIAIIFISIIIFLINVFIFKTNIIETIIFAVAVAVGAIPEGLPTIITMSLAYGANSLSKLNIIVKKLFKIETLGCINVILTDKTGTLTKGEMTAKEIFTVSDNKIEITGTGYDLKGKILKDNKIYESADLSEIILCAQACNESTLLINDNEIKIIGDTTEGSLLFIPYKYSLQLPKINFDKIQSFPFDSHRQMMSVTYRINANEKDIELFKIKVNENTDKKIWKIYSKGAPEILLERITGVLYDKKIVPVNKEIKKEINIVLNEMQQNGLRVLAFAEKIYNSQEMDILPEELEKDFIFLGLIGILDPERENVKEAVEKARNAGIRICMVTGDSPVIAEEISRRVGIITGKKTFTDNINNKHKIIVGNELDKISLEELEIILKNFEEVIFARTSPVQKAKIVKAFQELGYIVAVTGDGVNDAPALNLSNVGISMGKTGTEIAKNTASLVLADDSFHTIINGIEEGRKIYNNFKKTCYFILSTNAGELFTIIAGILLNLNPLFTAVLILIINVVTETLPAFGLGINESNEPVMYDKPRNINEKMMNKKFIFKILYMGLLISISIIIGYLWMLKPGMEIPENVVKDRIIAISFIILVFEKILLSYSMSTKNLFFVNISGNKIIMFSSAFSILVIYIVIFSPVKEIFIGQAIVNFNDIIKILILCFFILIIEESRKLYLILNKKI